LLKEKHNRNCWIEAEEIRKQRMEAMNDPYEFKKLKESEKNIYAQIEVSKLRSSQIKKESVSKLESFNAAKKS
jgi:hypothetical protein